MFDTTSATETLQHLYQDRNSFHKAGILRDLRAEQEAGNWEFIWQVAKALTCDMDALSHKLPATPLGRRLHID